MPTWQARRHSFSLMFPLRRCEIQEIELGVDVVIFSIYRLRCALLSAGNVRIWLICCLCGAGATEETVVVAQNPRAELHFRFRVCTSIRRVLAPRRSHAIATRARAAQRKKFQETVHWVAQGRGWKDSRRNGDRGKEDLQPGGGLSPQPRQGLLAHHRRQGKLRSTLYGVVVLRFFFLFFLFNNFMPFALGLRLPSSWLLRWPIAEMDMCWRSCSGELVIFLA